MKTAFSTNAPVAAEITKRTDESILHQPIQKPSVLRVTDPRSGPRLCEAQRLRLEDSGLTLRALRLLTAALFFVHTAFAAKPAPPPPPQPSSGTLVLSYPSASSWGLAASPSGMVYAVGNNHLTPGIAGGSQLVIGTGDGGNSWSVLDDFAPPGRYVDFFGVFDLGGGIASGPGGSLYTSGLSYPDELSNSDAHWYVRRSTDSGASWSNVDVFQLASSRGAYAMGIAANASGIYVVGIAAIASSSHWIVRKSTNGGNSWTTVDDYQLSAGYFTQARCIAADSIGNLFVAGQASTAQGIKWVLRKNPGSAGTWTTVDVFQNAGVATVPNAIAADVFGNVFVGGNDGSNWLIKKY